MVWQTSPRQSAENRRRQLDARLADAPHVRAEYRILSDALLAEAIRLGIVSEIADELHERIRELRPLTPATVWPHLNTTRTTTPGYETGRSAA